jgi:glutathione S-transferase
MAAEPPERIFHIARVADWEAAQVVGEYRVSTLGRSLEQEGFLHASHAGQWQAVYDAFYAGLDDPVVLLEIDAALLGVPVVEEAPPGTDAVFPHIYGPLPVAAVVAITPL